MTSAFLSSSLARSLDLIIHIYKFPLYLMLLLQHYGKYFQSLQLQPNLHSCYSSGYMVADLDRYTVAEMVVDPVVDTRWPIQIHSYRYTTRQNMVVNPDTQQWIHGGE